MIEYSCSGEYEFRVVGGPRDGLLLSRSKNLITDYGLDCLTGNNMGGAINLVDGPMYSCHIGNGTTTPSVSDVALAGSTTYWTTTVQSQVPASENVSPVTDGSGTYYEVQRTFRFSNAGLAGNFTEVGVGRSSGGLFSRALIVDAGGNPTSITILSGEQLDVTYKLRIYAPAAVNSLVGSGSFVINTVTYNYGIYLSGFPGYSGITPAFPGLAGLGYNNGDGRILIDWSLNTTYAGGTWAGQFYVNSSGAKQAQAHRRVTFTIPTTAMTSGVGRIYMIPGVYSMASYVIVFDKVIPKDAYSTLAFDFDFRMARA